MNDPETALKNAVFEYLLATNNVKSAEVFFKESNLQSQYDVSVDVMVHNTNVYGNSCLICKLFNNWYTFAHNQRLITPHPSVLVHANQKDENLEHMQQFLQFYHTHDNKHPFPHNCTDHNCTDHMDTNNMETNHTNNNTNNDNIIDNNTESHATNNFPPFYHTHDKSPHNTNSTDTSSSSPNFQFFHTHDHSNKQHMSPPTTNNTSMEGNNHNNKNKNSNFSSSLNTFSNPVSPPPLLSSSPTSPLSSSPNSFSTPATTTTTTITSNFAVNSVLSSSRVSPSSPLSPPSSVSSPPAPSLSSTPATEGGELNDKAKDDEFLFSVERNIKLFNNNLDHPPSETMANSDTLIQLLSLNSLPLSSPSPTPLTTITVSSPPPSTPTYSSPSPARAHVVPSQSITEETSAKEDSLPDFSDFDANVDVYNKAGRFCCPYPNCSKSFSTSAILKRHIKEHSGDRPYKCTFEGCGKGFARNYDLKVHMRSHTGEKPYRCTFMGCERTFTRSSDLRLHERIHKGEKPFVCDCAGCQKRFVRYADLKKHKRTHEVHEGHHPHVHGAGCGHTAIAHEDHIDYLHDAHLHNHHKDHIDDHKIGLTESNPITCTHTTAFTCDPTHTHNDNCGHELVPHYDHYDYLVDGHLHFVHDSHCDDHGWIDVVTWNPSDFPLEGTGGVNGIPSGTGTYGQEDDSG